MERNRITTGKRQKMEPHMSTREHENFGVRPEYDSSPVSREEYNSLLEEFYKLERTVYGIQQMLGKAAEYQGKPRGRLPR
jgi:hypothetical protein